MTSNDAYDAESTVCPVDGAVVFTDVIFPDPGARRLELDAQNAPDLRIRRLDLWPLKSIWPQP